MAHTPGPYIIGEPGGPAGPFYSIINSQGNVVAMQILNRDDAVLWKGATDMLAACEATCKAIEFRGKLDMHSFGELAEDESNWRDGVEPYLMDVYNQNLAAIAKTRGEAPGEGSSAPAPMSDNGPCET